MDETKQHTPFVKEYDLLANAKKLLESNNQSRDVLLSEFAALTGHFDGLLNKFVKVVKISDLNERKLYRAKEQINKKKDELETIIAKNRLLHGMLPICAACKKIRDDKGYWQEVEAYISDHTDTEFSHGICDECAHKLYPEYFKKKPGTGEIG